LPAIQSWKKNTNKKNITGPIFCKARETGIYSLTEATRSTPYMFLWLSTCLSSTRTCTFHWDFVSLITQLWRVLHVSRDCYPGFLSETQILRFPWWSRMKRRDCSSGLIKRNNSGS